MNIRDYKSGTIYKPIVPLEEEVFLYVRKFKNDEVGFSVLDKATHHPDFSNCGIFWVKAKDFLSVFDVYEFS